MVKMNLTLKYPNALSKALEPNLTVMASQGRFRLYILDNVEIFRMKILVVKYVKSAKSKSIKIK